MTIKSEGKHFSKGKSKTANTMFKNVLNISNL